MIKAVDLRKGKTILYEGQPAIVHDAQHVAKGNKRSYMQAKIKNLKSGRPDRLRGVLRHWRSGLRALLRLAGAHR